MHSGRSAPASSMHPGQIGVMVAKRTGKDWQKQLLVVLAWWGWVRSGHILCPPGCSPVMAAKGTVLCTKIRCCVCQWYQGRVLYCFHTETEIHLSLFFTKISGGKMITGIIYNNIYNSMVKQSTKNQPELKYWLRSTQKRI